MNYITIMINQDIEMQRNLKKAIKQYNNYIHFNIVSYINLEQTTKYDLVFLDIDQNGIEIATNLRNNGYTQTIIFYASSQKNAFQCFSLHPFDYLLKPLNEKKLEDILNQYLYFHNKVQKELMIRDSRNHPKYSISIDKIEYIESSNTKLIIHLVNREIIRMYAKLNNIEKEIDDTQFLRCHQSYLVNMLYIKHMGETFELASGSKIPIRVRNKHLIKQKFLQYRLEKD